MFIRFFFKNLLFYGINCVKFLKGVYVSIVFWYFKLCVKLNKKKDLFIYFRGCNYFYWELYNRGINRIISR